MRRRFPDGILPLRRWLGIALLIVFIVPLFGTATLAFHVIGSVPTDVTTDSARLLRDGVANWSDPTWRETTRQTLAADDVDFVLFDGDREIYRSASDPFARANGEDRIVRRVEVSDATGRHVAYLTARSDVGPPDAIANWITPIVLLTLLGLTLGGIAWFFGRTVVGPLSATADAARKVATGDLDIALPSSRVREVADVNAAFVAMGDALRDSLQHEAAMEQERRLFIGAVAHDLRTPLFSLRGYLEGLEKGLADTPEKRARYVATAQEKAAALERLVGDLFEFTRLEYLDQAPHRESLDLGVLLRRILDDVRPRAEAKGLTLSLDLPAGSYPVDGDAHLLTRVIENLFDNALRHTPNGGRVWIGCTRDTSGIRFTVADSGPGIPAADLTHLFKPLFRGETSRNRRTGGAGLGLTIARRIMLAHGGDLTAGNGLSGGAVFTGTLPWAALNRTDLDSRRLSRQDQPDAVLGTERDRRQRDDLMTGRRGEVEALSDRGEEEDGLHHREATADATAGTAAKGEVGVTR